MSLSFTYGINNVNTLKVDYKYSLEAITEVHQIQICYNHRQIHTTTLEAVDVSAAIITTALSTQLTKIKEQTKNSVTTQAQKSCDKIMEFIFTLRGNQNMMGQAMAAFVNGNQMMQANPYMQANPQSVQAAFVNAGMVQANPFMQNPQQNLNGFMLGGQANGAIREFNQVANNPNVRVAQKASKIVVPADKMKLILKKDTMDSITAQQVKKRRIDYNWVNKDDIIEELKCEMCKRYFFNPMKVSCGCTFCSTCVKDIKEKGENCPTCDEKLNHQLTGKDMMVVWTLEEMEVYCPNKIEMNCSWQGFIKELDYHQEKCEPEAKNDSTVESQKPERHRDMPVEFKIAKKDKRPKVTKGSH